MTTTTNELPGVWLLHLTNHAADDDDYAEYTLGAYVTLDLAKARVRQLLAMQGSDLLVWHPNAIPNLRSPGNTSQVVVNLNHVALSIEWLPLFRTADYTEVNVLQDRAIELNILEGDFVKVNAEHARTGELRQNYVAAVYRLIETHYRHFTRGQEPRHDINKAYSVAMRPRQGETLTSWKVRLEAHAGFIDSIGLAFGLAFIPHPQPPLYWYMSPRRTDEMLSEEGLARL